MYSKTLIKRKKKYFINRIINWIFVFSGTNFYMNWILPTNPQSKNPVIKFCWFGFKFKNAKNRFYCGIIYLCIHISGAIISYNTKIMWTIENIFINLYPIIIQLYIGYKCIKIMKGQYLNKKHRKIISENLINYDMSMD